MYQLPDNNILEQSDISDPNQNELHSAEEQGDLITEKLDELGMRCEIDSVNIGPQVIRFGAVAAEKVQVRNLPRYSQEIQYELGSQSVNILAPIPGEKLVGIEISRTDRQLIKLGDVIHSAQSPLTVPLGITPENNILATPINDMPHLLVAGMTGAGKSVGLHNMICSLLMKSTPDDLSFLMIDTKMVELPIYDGIPNLICPVVTDAWQAIDELKILVAIMEKRYKLAQEYSARNLAELNEKIYPDKIPYILTVIDELADVMMLSKYEVEESITRLAQKGRACGLHLVASTQTPRRDILSGLIKSNLPSRLAFSTYSGLDSRIILDKMGAEKLLGNGDALYSEGGKPPIRIQTPLVTTAEIEQIVSHWSNQNIKEIAA